MLKLPFFAELEKTNNILIAGAGGGFDIFCGLPMYFALKNAGKQVLLANLSFSQIYASTGNHLLYSLVEVDANTKSLLPYFPEIHLARWLAIRDEPTPIYCIARSGTVPVRDAYKAMVEQHNIDTIILVDGGTDSLMRGDEAGLGTPEEDIASIAAVDQLDVPIFRR
jgi:hypothetical protein